MESGSSVVDSVVVDGLVVMRIVKHCHESWNASRSASDAYGPLFGLCTDDNQLEVTNAFPLPRSGSSLIEGVETSEKVNAAEVERSLKFMLRHVNIDHQQVGWYQCVNFGTFLSPEFLSTHKRMYKKFPESVCLVFDMANLRRGYLSVKAYRLGAHALDVLSSDKFSPDAVIGAGITHDNMFEEIPLVIRNSNLINLLLVEMSEASSHMSADTLSSVGTHETLVKEQFLDLGSADTLEGQMRDLIQSLDELNAENIKYNRYQLAAAKQLQEKTRFIQKRQLENSGRVARGEDPLPDEDLNKIFKPLMPPERKTPLLMAAKASAIASATERICAQNVGKWFVAEALYKGRATSQHSSSSQSQSNA